jgi:hypothetical protein
MTTDLDPDDGYLPDEALCACHHLTFNRHLGACPITAAETTIPRRVS